MKEIKSFEFARLLNISIQAFAKLRSQGVIPKPIETYYRGRSGAVIITWPIKLAKDFAKTFDHKSMNKKHGLKKTILERKKSGATNAEKFNNLMMVMVKL